MKKPSDNTLAHLASSSSGVVMSSQYLKLGSKDLMMACALVGKQVAAQAQPTECQVLTNAKLFLYLKISYVREYVVMIVKWERLRD